MAEDTKVSTEDAVSADSFYDHKKVQAFINCCIDLAKVNELGIFEFLMASRNMLLAAEMQLAKGAKRIEHAYPELSEE